MRAVSSSLNPTVMNSANRDPDSSSTPNAAYLASTRSDPTSVMRRNASARDCSDPIAITASSNRSNCFAPANSKRLGTTGGYDPPPLASPR